MKKSTIFLATLGCLAFLFALMFNLQITEGGDFETTTIALAKEGEPDEDGIFDGYRDFTVTCEPIEWTQTTYYSEEGTIVGVLFIEGGVVKVSYSGSYGWTIEESGTTVVPPLQGWQCDRNKWGTCTSDCINPCTGEC